MSKRFLSTRLTLRQRLMLLGGSGLALVVLLTGANVFTDRLKSTIEERRYTASTMVRYQLEADMMHDALRADSYQALLSAAETGADAEAAKSAQAEIEQTVEEHRDHMAEQFEENLHLVRKLDLPAVETAIAQAQGKLDGYAKAAQAIVAAAFSDLESARQMRGEFQTVFEQLEGDMSELSELIGQEAAEDEIKLARVESTVLWIEIATVALAALFSLFMILSALRAVVRPLAAMTAAMKKIADGDFSAAIPSVDDRNEIGEMAGALIVLRDVSIEAACAKSALENVSANVMVADTDGKIVLMNKALSAMMKTAETEIRKTLPRFDAANLLGRNIDEFHKKPSHQRNLLANLTDTYRSQIRIAGRTFNLVATPSLNSGGERVGTSVEWYDVTQELANQAEIAELVKAVANGDLSRRLDLDAKSGFIKVLAEGINQITHTVGGAVSEIATMMSAMARGDLSKRITGDYQGDFLKLKTDANATAEKLAQVVGQTTEGMANIKASTTEIASGATDLSSRTEEQVASLEEIAASIRQLNSTVQQSAENAGQASQLAVAARGSAEGGGEIANAAVKAMGEIEQSSQKISDIVGMIDEIAFQTNLLALNAAVEAARAGEAGRGFAVVAGEVRALAQHSSQASKEIKTLISNSNTQVKQGVELVNKAGSTLGEIVTSVKRVSDIVAEIAAANKEQSASVAEVQDAIGQIEQATQQNAALVEETTAALGSADNQVQGVTDVIGFFKSDAVVTAKPANTSSPAKGAKVVQARLTTKVAKPSDGPAKSSGGKKIAATGAGGWEEF